MNVRLLGSVLLFALAACADNGATGDTGGTMIIVVPAGWTAAPPPVITDQLAKTVDDLLYDRLAEIGSGLNTIGDGGFQPRLARSWSWSKDSLSITFQLDPRARWHDGKPVRATDVAFTVALFKDPKVGSSAGPLLANIDSVTVKDSMSAVAWYRRRTPEQFYDLVYQVQIMPEHIWASVPRTELGTSAAARTPVGSGRFRFARFEPGVKLEVIADTANYRGRAKLDRIVWSIVPDMGAAVTQLLTGQADLLEVVPPDILGKVDSTESLRALKYNGLQYGFLGFNHRDPKRLSAAHPILGDRRVRRALSMALDRQSMLTNVYGARGTLGVGPFPLGLADTTVKLLPFDRAHAKALLDSAGWVAGKDGIRAKGGAALKLGLMVPGSSRVRARYGVMMQEQLKEVGVNVTIESMDFTAFLDRQAKGQFDMATIGTGSDPSPASAKQSWGSAAIGNGGQNFVGYSSKVFDATMDSATMAFDPAVARAAAHRAYQAVVDDAPAVWLYDVLTVGGVHKRIRPANLRVDGWWADLADWWIPSNERLERDRVGLRPATP
jgi:peptide/nickel transport system substrate-binding protein